MAPSWLSNKRWRRWGARLLLATTIAGGLAYLPYRVLDGPGARRLSAMESDLEETRRAIEELEEKNAKLKRDIGALKKDPHAVEDIARDDLNMVYPDEIVIRVERGER